LRKGSKIIFGGEEGGRVVGRAGGMGERGRRSGGRGKGEEGRTFGGMGMRGIEEVPKRLERLERKGTSSGFWQQGSRAKLMQ
jgi:hypothetical protein